MKHILITALMLVVSLLGGASAHAQTNNGYVEPTFSCGPFMKTYTVRALDGRDGFGIRCVKFSDGYAKGSNAPVLAWYGEGYWGTCTYRHVGQANMYTGNRGKVGPILKGYASDTMGNGECATANYPGNITMQLMNAKTIRVTGAWNEQWTLVDSTNYSPLSTPTTCGQHFNEFKAFTVEDNEVNAAYPYAPSGQGLRCMLKVGQGATTWVGYGNWHGVNYMHLATKSTQGTGASDICDAQGTRYCNNFAYGSLRLTYSKYLQTFMVEGWNEWWQYQTK